MTTTTTRNGAEHRAPSGRRAAGSDTPREGGLLRGIASGVVTVLLVTVVALALSIAVVPRILGGAALTVLSGSMEPTYSPGDVVVAVPQERYVTGDVVTFQPVPGDPTLVTHRVVSVAVSADGVSYVTRGDANGADDEPIRSEQVMGRVVYSIPWIGNLTSLAGSRAPLLVTTAALALIGYGAYQFVGGALEQRRRPGAATAAPKTLPKDAS